MMQTIMRMMDNCSLATIHVKGIQDDLSYYVDSNQDADFYENEMMYDDLDLEEVQSTVFPATGGCGHSLIVMVGGCGLDLVYRVQCSLLQVGVAIPC